MTRLFLKHFFGILKPVVGFAAWFAGTLAVAAGVEKVSGSADAGMATWAALFILSLLALIAYDRADTERELERMRRR